MTEVRQRQAQMAQIRRLPIAERLVAILKAAGEEVGIDRIDVMSGGQHAAGQGPRTGSDRHDEGKAADVDLYKDGRLLNFETGDRALVAAFVTACAARGATGIGAAVDYMGPSRIHVGFGTQLVWGEDGRAALAPRWLKEAAAAGWAAPIRMAIRSGDQGEDVKDLQRALNAAGFNAGAADGHFGARTETALKAFQTARGLVADGVAGPKTLRALAIA